MFTAKDVTVGNGSKYQSAGISEKVKITEIILNDGASPNIDMKTINENKEVGQSKRLFLNTEVKPGKQTSAFKVSAKYLINVLMSTGKTLEEAQNVLEAKTLPELIKNLNTHLIGKEFRGLFSKKEYQPGKFYTELYATEKVGGTKLVWDTTNPHYVSRLPQAESAVVSTTDDMPS